MPSYSWVLSQRAVFREYTSYKRLLERASPSRANLFQRRSLDWEALVQADNDQSQRQQFLISEIPSPITRKRTRDSRQIMKLIWIGQSINDALPSPRTWVCKCWQRQIQFIRKMFCFSVQFAWPRSAGIFSTRKNTGSDARSNEDSTSRRYFS